MVLGDVEETVTTVEVDEDTYEEIVRVRVGLGLMHFAVALAGHCPLLPFGCSLKATPVRALEGRAASSGERGTARGAPDL